jgi:2',3'-cyclic-nucleotide 2'-phosphodiesterase/3'-nucleotidase
MPVLAANRLMEGKLAGEFPDGKHPFARIQPFVLKEVAGIKLAIIGVTTSGMPFWLWPEFIRGMGFPHPVEPVRRAIAGAKREGADSIVLTGHMGLKTRTGGDDLANTVMALTSEFPEIGVFIAGHTHRDTPSRLTNGVLFSQADHFGIRVGRVYLLFERKSKKLLRREEICELTDNRLPFDRVVLSRAKSQLAESDATLSRLVNWQRRCGFEATGASRVTSRS